MCIVPAFVLLLCYALLSGSFTVQFFAHLSQLLCIKFSYFGSDVGPVGLHGSFFKLMLVVVLIMELSRNIVNAVTVE